jgi:hypothetical protein
MLQFNSLLTERTTAATDAMLGFLCIALVARFQRFRARNPWKTGLWSWVFGLLSAASLAGAVVHGLDLSPALRNLLWQPLYLALGIVVALFVTGSVCDWRGEKAARPLVPGAIAAGVVFYSLTLVLNGSFLAFVVYEGAAMISALAIYTAVAVGQRRPGSAAIAAAIGLNIVAAALQASSLRFTFIWPFDHNGIFHLVQATALLVLGYGLSAGMES